MSGIQKAGNVPGGGKPPGRSGNIGKGDPKLGVVQEGGKDAKKVVSSKEHGGSGSGTLEEKSSSLKEVREHRSESTGSKESWGSRHSGEAGFRLMGHPENDLEGVELKSKEFQGTGKSAKADKLGETSVDERAAHLKSQIEGHTTDSGGSPMVSFTLDPVNLWRSGDQKLLNMLVKAEYLAVGHFRPDEMVVPAPHFNNQVKEMEFVVVPKDGELKNKVDVYPNPFKGMDLTQPEADLVKDAKQRWGSFLKARKIDPNAMKVSIRNPEVAGDGFHKTRTESEGTRELNRTYARRPGNGARWGEKAMTIEEKMARLKQQPPPKRDKDGKGGDSAKQSGGADMD